MKRKGNYIVYEAIENNEIPGTFQVAFPRDETGIEVGVIPLDFDELIIAEDFAMALNEANKKRSIKLDY